VSTSPHPLPAGSAEPSSFGFQVRSHEPLRFLRSGGGRDLLEVVVGEVPKARPQVDPLADWTLPGMEHRVRATVYRVDSGFEYWVTDVGAFRIDPGAGRIEMPDAEDGILREQRLWGLPTTLCYAHRGDLSLHAAAVEVDDGAIVLAAPGRHGKTTLALAFHECGFRVLSEDLSCCRIGAEPAVLPGPALIRIRPDVYAGHPPAGTHVVVEREGRVYLGIDQERRGSSAPVPLRAIVFLRESDGHSRIEPATPAVALADMWHLNFRLPDNDGRARSFRQLSVLAGCVPIWNLHRPLTRASLHATVGMVARRLEAGS
jgi:hypothetical protein